MGSVKRVGRDYTAITIGIIIFLLLSYGVSTLFTSLDAHYELDSYNYMRVADYWYRSWLLCDPCNSAHMPVYPLGYPLFLGIIYRTIAPSLTAICIVQIILGIISLLLAFDIANRLFSSVVARYTVLLLGMHGGIILYAQLVMSEVLVMTMLLASWQRLLKFQVTRANRYLYQASFWLGISLTIKTIALIWVPLFLMYAYNSGDRSWYRGTTALLLCALAPAACVWHNYLRYDCLQFSPQLHENTYHYFLPKVVARVEDISCQDAHAQILLAEDNQRHTDYLWRYVVSHPLTSASVWVTNMAKTWFGLFTTQLKVVLNQSLRGGACSYDTVVKNHGSFYDYCVFGTDRWWVAMLAIIEFFLIWIRTLCAIIGFWLLQKSDTKSAYLIGAYIISCLLITGFDGCFRFRIVYEPFLVMGAIAGFLQIISYVSNRVSFRARSRLI